MGGLLTFFVFLIGVAVLVALIVAGNKSDSQPSEESEDEEASSESEPDSVSPMLARPESSWRTLFGPYRPPEPVGRPVRPWGLTRHYNVVGISHRPENLAAVVGQRRRLKSGETVSVNGLAQLVPAIHNPHDSNAVAVWMKGYHVGYLARKDAAKHIDGVVKLARRGEIMTLDARALAFQFHAESSLGGQLGGGVTIQLPSPDGYGPLNDYPSEPYILLPRGSTIKVTKTEEHLETLAKLVGDRGQCYVAATLRPIVHERARSTVDLIEVSVNGDKIGVLTPLQSKNLKPLVDHIVGLGAVPVAQARLKGNEVKVNANLYAQKAEDVDQKWLDSPPIRRG